ncbi:MAG TPA: decaprenyl-phosphate phosphoribosyltransferase [Longimicrobium sp.]|nr:decaprenyl-phosphate phosphoribosyltransferase [Longimicrobium sp.]
MHVAEPQPQTDTRTAGAPPPSAGGALARLVRPRQWIKNAFVLAPTVFAGLYLDPPSVLRAVVAVALFCVAASAVYVFNDLADLETDRLHPVKRLTRPLASGAVSAATARAVLGVLVALLCAGLVALPAVALPIAAYIALNAAYTLRLKHVAVVDLFCIASGFVLRVYAGAEAVGVPLSSWMLITTLSLALYLAAVKRRQELATSGAEARRVLGAYTVGLLDGYAQTAASASIVFYSLYVIDVRPELAVTVPLVLLGIFRYSYLVQSRNLGESPTEALWNDLPLILTIVAWCVVAVYQLWPGAA